MSDPNKNQDIVYQLITRAEIRRNAKGRKSVEEGKPDRIADLLEAAAQEISDLRFRVDKLKEELGDLESIIQEMN